MPVTVSSLAYAKIVLHAAKHAQRAVSGLAIGHVEGGDISVDDVLPLFHVSMSAPLLESACGLAEGMYPGEAEGSTGDSAEGRPADRPRGIVGFYFANERDSDAGVPPLVERVMSKISEATGVEGVLLQLQNRSLASDDLAVRALGRDQRRGWKRQVDLAARPSASAAETLVDDLLKGEQHKSIVDFDEHCEDPTRDWNNAWLARQAA